MYGIIYIAIKEYAKGEFGTEKWDAILAESGVNVDFNLTEQPYNDFITYAIAKAASKTTGIPLDAVLYNFGRQVILTTNSRFKPIMSSRGETLNDYLLNLPNFHNRISLIYPELSAPEFRVSDVQAGSIMVHYRVKQPGMAAYVSGYLNGLAEVFNETATVTHVSGGLEEVYKITW